MIIFRGDSFRHVIRTLGEVRSLIPKTVRMMALTGTKFDRISFSRTIGLNNPYVLIRSPVKNNLVYCVKQFVSLKVSFNEFCEKLKQENKRFSKTIIYGRSLSVCGDVYIHLKNQLGSAFTCPEDAPDIPEFRLVDMFTSITEFSNTALLQGELQTIMLLIS